MDKNEIDQIIEKSNSGKVLEIKDMYAFCEYVKNSW